MEASKAPSIAAPRSQVAVLSFPFNSHAISLLKLVYRLAGAAPNVKFSFLNTRQSNSSLFKPASEATLFPNIKHYDITAAHEDDPDAFIEASPDYFRNAIQSAVAQAGTDVNCLLIEAFLSAALAHLADQLRVPWIAVWSPSPLSLSGIVHGDHVRQRCAAAASAGLDPPLDFVPGLSGMSVSDYFPMEIVSGNFGCSVVAATLSQLGRVLPRAAAVVLNSYRELNPVPLIHDLESKFQAVLNVGILTVPFPFPSRPFPDSDPTGIFTWLDQQKTNSVAFISFGTAVTLPPNEVTATAESLEESETPFLWSLPDSVKCLLPYEFLERTRKWGKIVAWTPQSRVLGHDSVGAHVTHCGCNSVNESLVNGVPMICRPFWADNYMNGKMVQHTWGIGVKVAGGIITKSGLIKALDLVLAGEEGKKMRERAQELKDLVSEASGPNGSAIRDFKALMGLISSAF